MTTGNFALSATVLAALDSADLYSALTGHDVDDEDLFDVDSDADLYVVECAVIGETAVTESTRVTL